MNIFKETLLFLLLVFSTSLTVNAQRYYNQEKHRQLYLGIGSGMDYGGIGTKIECLPVKYVGIFGGVGTNLDILGVNAGMSVKILPNSRITPVIQGMYGYNGVIIVNGLNEYNKTYYGFSTGIGADWKFGERDHKLYFGLFYPFRPQAFYDDAKKVKADPRISRYNEALPITISIGFNWSLL